MGRRLLLLPSLTTTTASPYLPLAFALPAAQAGLTLVDVALDAWYAEEVQAAYDAALLTPCQTSPESRFCPDDPLTQAPAAYMMVQAKGLH